MTFEQIPSCPDDLLDFKKKNALCNSSSASSFKSKTGSSHFKNVSYKAKKKNILLFLEMRVTRKIFSREAASLFLLIN